MKQLRFLLKLSVMSVITLVVTTFTGVDCVYASADEDSKSAENINISNIDLTMGLGGIVSNAFEENIKAVAEGVDKDDKDENKVEYWAKTEKFSSSIENLKRLFTFVWSKGKGLINEAIYGKIVKRFEDSIENALDNVNVENGKNDERVKKALGLINGLMALKTLYKVGNEYKGKGVDKKKCEMIFDEVWTESSNDTRYCEKLLKYFGDNKNGELKEIVEHDWKCYLTQFFVICNGKDQEENEIKSVVEKVSRKIAEPGNKGIIIENIENAKTSTNVSSVVMKQQTKIESNEKEKEKKPEKNKIYINKENDKDIKDNIKSEKNLNEDIKNSAKSENTTKTEIYSTLKSILKSVKTDGDSEKDNLMKCYMDEIVKFVKRVNNVYYHGNGDDLVLEKLKELSDAEDWTKKRFINFVSTCLVKKMLADEFSMLINIVESVLRSYGIIEIEANKKKGNHEVIFEKSIYYVFHIVNRVVYDKQLLTRNDVSDMTDGCVLLLYWYLKNANVSLERWKTWSAVERLSGPFRSLDLNKKFQGLGDPLINLMKALPKKVEDPLDSDLFRKISELYSIIEDRIVKEFADYGEGKKIETYSAELNKIVQLIGKINELDKPSKTSTGLLDIVIELYTKSDGKVEDAIDKLNALFNKNRDKIKYVTDLNKYID